MKMNTLFKPLSLALAAAVMTACVSEPAPSDGSSSSVSSEAMSSSSKAMSSSSVAVSSSSEAQQSSSSVASSSSVMSSSSAVMVSSSMSSMASSSSAPVAGEPDLARGRDFYEGLELNCSGCHKINGVGGGNFPQVVDISQYTKATDTSLDGLADYILNAMVKVWSQSDESVCDLNCSRDIAAYILNGLDAGGSSSSTGNNTGGGDAISAEAQAARVAAGKQAYADNACGLCHQDNGETLVQFGSGDNLTSRSLKNCPSCYNYNSLVSAISATMPKGDTSGDPAIDSAFGPTSCVGDCAKATADYIWVEILGGTLTTGGGTLENNVTPIGFDTLRVKSYEAIKADYERVFGEVPESLEASAGAFRETPDYWYEKRSLGAVSLNVLANAAVEACQNEDMPQMTSTAIRAKCGEWAERMWLRPATGEELDSCVETAMNVTSGLSTTKKQLEFTCASMMISMPALTY